MSTSKLYPTYYGYVGSTKDALLIIQEIVDKQLELVPRRPHERERPNLIKSGNVFVFIEEHSGIKRWTDGIAWSPSRILGRFLVYRELDKHSLSEKDDKKKKKRKISVDQDPLDNSVASANSKQRGLSIPHAQQLLPQTEGAHDYTTNNKNLLGNLVTSYVFKDQGLIKKTLSLTTTTKELHIEKREAKQTIHLISYYNADDVLNGKLQRPSKTDLKDLTISNALWNSVKDSSLGGKIPIEDEAYYFLDNNYQLQNMSLLQQAPQTTNQALVAHHQHRGQGQPQHQHPGQHQQLQHHQLQRQIISPQHMQYMPQKYGVQPQSGNESVPPGYSRHNSHPPTHAAPSQQYVSPVTQQQQTQQNQQQIQSGIHQTLAVDYGQYQNSGTNIKRDDDVSNSAVVANPNELTFINPFTGAPHQSSFSYGQNNLVGQSSSAPGGASGPQSLLNMGAPQQFHPGYTQPQISQSQQHDPNLATNSSNAFFPPFPQHYQQQLYANQQQPQQQNQQHHGQVQQPQAHLQGHLGQQQPSQQAQQQQSYHLGTISGSTDQFAMSGISNGSISSIASNIVPGSSTSNSISGGASNTASKKSYRSSSGGTASNSISGSTGNNSSTGGWFTTNPPIGSGSYVSAPPPPLGMSEGGDIGSNLAGPGNHLYHPINNANSGSSHSNLSGGHHHFYMHPSHPLANSTTSGMSGSAGTLAGGSEETTVPPPAAPGSTSANASSYGYQNSS